MGYVFLGIASYNVIGLNGAALLMLAHGLSIAALFAMCGELRKQTGTLNYLDLGGLGTSMPTLCFVFGLATFASIGLPGFANFASELLVFFGAFKNSTPGAGFNEFQIVGTIALWGVVISAVYMLRAYRAIFMGERQASLASGKRHADEPRMGRRSAGRRASRCRSCYPEPFWMLLNQEFGFSLNDNPSSFPRIVRARAGNLDSVAGIIRRERGP